MIRCVSCLEDACKVRCPEGAIVSVAGDLLVEVDKCGACDLSEKAKSVGAVACSNIALCPESDEKRVSADTRGGEAEFRRIIAAKREVTARQALPVM
jgi:Fe-S-cluster-containing hydrogenase component 2